jgi:hypothetical protein
VGGVTANGHKSALAPIANAHRLAIEIIDRLLVEKEEN